MLTLSRTFFDEIDGDYSLNSTACSANYSYGYTYPGSPLTLFNSTVVEKEVRETTRLETDSDGGADGEHDLFRHEQVNSNGNTQPIIHIESSQSATDGEFEPCYTWVTQPYGPATLYVYPDSTFTVDMNFHTASSLVSLEFGADKIGVGGPVKSFSVPNPKAPATYVNPGLTGTKPSSEPDPTWWDRAKSLGRPVRDKIGEIFSAWGRLPYHKLWPIIDKALNNPANDLIGADVSVPLEAAKAARPILAPLIGGVLERFGGKKAVGEAAEQVVKHVDDVAEGAGVVFKHADDAKNVPNPFGRKGGPLHQEKVQEVFDDIKRRGLEAETEYPVPLKKTPGVEGHKTRYADVVAIDPVTKEPVELHQVGKSLKDGLTGVAREKRALTDIEKNLTTPATVKFHGYNP